METSNSPFRIGQRVVCVDDDWDETADPDEVYPVKGQPYSVRSIDFFEDRWFIRLKEIINNYFQYSNGYGEIMFQCENFAPIEPLYADVREELAKEAMNVHDTADQPIKELINSN